MEEAAGREREREREREGERGREEDCTKMHKAQSIFILGQTQFSFARSPLARSLLAGPPNFTSRRFHFEWNRTPRSQDLNLGQQFPDKLTLNLFMDRARMVLAGNRVYDSQFSRTNPAHVSGAAAAAEF